MQVVLVDKVLVPAMALLDAWHKNKVFERVGLQPGALVLLLGGGSAWKLARGLKLDDSDDVDLYFQGNDQMILPVDCMREVIGPEVAMILGYTPAQIMSHKDQYRDKSSAAFSYYHLEKEGVDYNIGSRKIYSNFQISINIETGFVAYDPRVPTHEKDFKEFVKAGKIISYGISDLIKEFHVEHERGVKLEKNKYLSILTFIFKSYLKPLEQGMHFHSITANELILLRNKPKNAFLFTEIDKRLTNFYKAPENSLGLIFVQVQANLNFKVVFPEIKRSHVTKKKEQESVEVKNELAQEKLKNETLTQQIKSREAELKYLTLDLEETKSREEKQGKDLEEKGKELLSSKKQSKDLLESLNKNIKQFQDFETRLSTELSSNLTQMQEMKEIHSIIQKQEELYKSELEWQCMMGHIAIYLRNRLSGREQDLEFSGMGNQLCNSDLQQIKSSTRFYERIQYECAISNLCNIRNNEDFFIAFYNTLLYSQTSYVNYNEDTVFEIFIDLDKYIDSNADYNLVAKKRMEILSNFIHTAVAFIGTEFASPNAFQKSPFFKTLSNLSARMLSERKEDLDLVKNLAELLNITDKIMSFLKKNQVILVKFLSEVKLKGSAPYTNDLDHFLDGLLALEKTIPKRFPTLSNRVCDRFLEWHGFHENHFKVLISKRTESKEKETRRMILEIWDKVYVKHMTPPRKASNKDKEKLISREAIRKFFKTFSEELEDYAHKKNPVFLLKAYLIVLKNKHPDWRLASQWTSHHFVKSLSVLFACESELQITDSAQWPHLISRALAELTYDPLFPEGLLSGKSDQELKFYLSEFITAFLLVLPVNDTALTMYYVALAALLNDPDKSAKPLLFSRGNTLMIDANASIGKQATAGQIFLLNLLEPSKYFENQTAEISLGSHIADCSLPLIQRLGEFFKQFRAFEQPPELVLAFELRAILSQESTFNANCGKLMRVFKETQILEKYGVMDHLARNNCIVLSMRIQNSYHALKEKLADLSKCDPVSLLEDFSELKVKLDICDIARILTAVLPVDGPSDRGDKIQEFSEVISKGLEVPARALSLVK